MPGKKNQQISHHHHISVMELGHLLTRSGLTYPEVSSKVCHDSFCQLANSVSLPWVIYYEAFYLQVVSSFSCIPVIYLKLVLFLIPLQFLMDIRYMLKPCGCDSTPLNSRLSNTTNQTHFYAFIALICCPVSSVHQSNTHIHKTA